MRLLELMDDEEIMESIKTDEDRALAIHNDDEADEVLSQILWAKHKIEENNELVKQKAAELKLLLMNYEERLNGPLKHYAENRSKDLEAYATKKLENQKGSVKLFHGTVSMREDAGRTEVDDEEELIRWMKQTGHTDCVTVKEALSKTALKKAFKKDPSGRYFVDENGDVIQGVHIAKEEGLQLRITEAKPKKAEVVKGAA